MRPPCPDAGAASPLAPSRPRPPAGRELHDHPRAMPLDTFLQPRKALGIRARRPSSSRTWAWTMDAPASNASCVLSTCSATDRHRRVVRLRRQRPGDRDADDARLASVPRSQPCAHDCASLRCRAITRSRLSCGTTEAAMPPIRLLPYGISFAGSSLGPSSGEVGAESQERPPSGHRGPTDPVSPSPRAWRSR